MTTVVVSPHLDDAVFSIAELLWTRTRAGEHVVVLSVFTEGDERHAARRAEDRAALAILGVEPAHLGLVDAPLRRGIPETFRGLVLEPVADADADAHAVAERIAHALLSLAPAEVLFPLGVGEHVDHRIVHSAHPRFDGRLAFYEERPYAQIRHATRARLARLGAIVDGAAIEPSTRAVDEMMDDGARAPFVRAHLPKDAGAECLARLAEPLARPARPTGLRLTTHEVSVDPSGDEVCARACRAYESQWAAFLGGERYAERRRVRFWTREHARLAPGVGSD